MNTIAVAIQKGGTGKTTTAATLATTGAIKGKKVLAIDLDPQGNLTFTLNGDTNRPGAIEFLQNSATDFIQHTKSGVDLIAASERLSVIASEKGTEKGSARLLQKALEPLKKKYDICIIDTPPTAGILQYMALQAADRLVIPLEAETYSIQGLYQIVDTAKAIQKSNPNLSIKGYVLTKFRSSSISKAMANTLQTIAARDNIKCLGNVRNGVAVAEAAATQEPLLSYAPKSNPAIDYLAVYEKLFQ